MIAAACLYVGAAALSSVALVLALLVFGLVFHRSAIGGHALALALAVLIGYDVTLNAYFGGHAYSTISCRIGQSLEAGGWASRVAWPAWWVAHCKASIFVATV